MPTPTTPFAAALPHGSPVTSPTPVTGLAPPARRERDSAGEVEVPNGARWGSHTARSLQAFAVGQQRMPTELIRAIAHIKAEAARVNGELGLLGAAEAKAICHAAQRVAEGEFEGQFPLSVWQPGSGTHSHMNVNEVIAQLASESLPAPSPGGVDAHADVSCGQLATDVFPSAVHIAVALQMKARLLPALQRLQAALLQLAQVTGIQPLSGQAAELALCEASLRQALPAVHRLTLGGCAENTALNIHLDFGSAVTARLAQRLQLPLTPTENLLPGIEALVALHAGLRMLALALTKIAGNIRMMVGNPQVGLSRLNPANPTQLEVLTMVCAQVMGHDTAIGFAASLGQVELNTCKPLMALNALDSIRLLSDGMQGFAWQCASDLHPTLADLQHRPPAAQVPASAFEAWGALAPRESDMAPMPHLPDRRNSWINPLMHQLVWAEAAPP